MKKILFILLYNNSFIYNKTMNVDLFFYIYLFFSIFFEISAQYLFKLIHLKKTLNYDYKFVVTIGVIFYALTGFFAFKLLSYAELGVINIIWHVFHFLILFIIGYLFLNEKLSIKKIVASIIGLISLMLFITDNDRGGHVH
tara:strand:- start:172 stop:594 length:423 start_codon:yes stop_codon:yes gene_type:complete